MSFGSPDSLWKEERTASGPILRDLGPGENEGNVDKRLRGAHEKRDVPPRLEQDPKQNLLLTVEPGSIQAELFTRANLTVLWRKTEALQQGGLPKDEELGLRAEVRHLEILNTRLRDRNPDQDKPKPPLRERIGRAILSLSASGMAPQSQRTNPEGVASGNTFANTDATLLLHNLSLAAADLRAQVQQGGVVTDPNRASNLAEAMIDLRQSTMAQVESLPAPQMY